MGPVLLTEIVTFQFPLPKVATATSDVGSSDSKPTRDALEGGTTSSSAALNLSELTCSRTWGLKWASMTCADKGTSDTAPRNHASWAPTSVSGIVEETKDVELDAVVVVTLGGVARPYEPPQLAATSEIAKIDTAYEMRRDTFMATSLWWHR
jgi:hypothetical protein